MMWSVSREVEDALWAAAAACLPERSRKHKALVPAILRRSAIYTVDRDDLGDDTEQPGISPQDDLAARALFFSLADAAKVAVPIAELEVRGALPGGPLRLLDVGAGCGAMSLGVIDRCRDREIHITAIDTDREALAVMDAALGALGRDDVSWETRASSVLRGGVLSGEYDLVVAGNLLNELDERRAATLAAALIDRLSAGGALVIIEPATRELSRRLHGVRDQIIAASKGFIFAPCTRAAAPCPALADERDWCHEDRPFGPTPRLASLTRATGLRTKHLKFSYLVVRRTPGSLAPVPGLLRVVSALRKSKGQSELFACGDDGRTSLRLQKRDRNDRTRSFERARRGDLIEVGPGSYQRRDPTRE